MFDIFDSPDLEGTARQMTNCKYVMEMFLMNQYTIYKYRIPIAFIVAALLMPFILRKFGIKDGSHTSTYIFLFFVYFVIERSIVYIVRFLLPSDLMFKMLSNCKGWQEDPSTVAECKSVVNAAAAAEYVSKKEHFTVEPLHQRTDDDDDEPAPSNSVEGFTTVSKLQFARRN